MYVICYFFEVNSLIRFKGKSLLKSLQEAILMAKSQTQQFVEFQKTIPQNIIDDWECHIREWDALKDKKNGLSPYHDQVSSMSYCLFG